MLTYNKKNNKGEFELAKFITTDDILIGSDSTKSMEDLTTAIALNSADIVELKSNIKWLAAHGGSGSGGSGNGGDSSSMPACAFSVTITYTDLDNVKHTDENIISATDVTKTATNPNKYILVKPNTAVLFKLLLRYNASSSMYIEGNSLNISTESKSTLFNASTLFINMEYEYSYSVDSNSIITFHSTYNSEKTKYDRYATFMIFTNVVSSKLGVYVPKSGLDVLVTTKLLKSILDKNGYTLWGQVLPSYKFFTVSNFQTSITYKGKTTPIKELTNTEGGYSTSQLSKYITDNAYGIYTITLSYDLSIEGKEPTHRSFNSTFVYQDTTYPFIYCTSSVKNSVYVELLNTSDNALVTYSLNQIPLNFIIYGRSSDPSNTKYAITITVGEQTIALDSTYEIETTNTLYFANNNNTESILEVCITFTLENRKTTYYIYTKKAETASFILKNKGQYLYYVGNRLGDTYNNTFSDFFEGSLPLGTDTYTFQTDTSFTVKSTITDYANSTYIYFDTENNSDEVNDPPASVANFVDSSRNCQTSANQSKTQDCIICFGVKNKVLSKTGELFRLTEGSNAIVFTNTGISSISSGKEHPLYSKIAFPLDLNFHLISIYIKSDYRDLTTSLTALKTVFAVYIDGVLEMTPTETALTFGGTDFTLTFKGSASYYNFIGGAALLPRPSSWSSQGKDGIHVEKDAEHCKDCIYTYLTSLDPIIPANYYAVYQNCFNEATGGQPKLATLSFSTYSMFTGSDGYSWISHFYSGDKYSINNKFTLIGNPSAFLQELANLAGTLPIYRICPVGSIVETGPDKQPQGINNFLYGTILSSNYNTEPVFCTVEKLVSDSNNIYSWKEVFSLQDVQNKGYLIKNRLFSIKYQGTSTMKYSVKNFELATVAFSDLESTAYYLYYFNPNVEVFKYPETSFNLKADLVDSSSSTNNVIGNIVNKYMTSPFGDEYLSCLSGMPILLCMQNNILLGTDTKDMGTFILGIYNWNLNRASSNNLGYQSFKDNVPYILSEIDNKALLWVVTDPANQINMTDFMSAEVKENDGLFDFSLYDAGFLRDKMFDKFKLGDKNAGIIRENVFDTALVKAIRWLALKTRELITASNGSTYFGIINYEECLQKYRALEVSSLPKRDYYYYNSDGKFELIQDSNVKYYACKDENSYIPKEVYHTLTSMENRSVPIIGDCNTQFRLIYTKNSSSTFSVYTTDSGDNILGMFANEDTLDTEESVTVDLASALQYYCICMAFGMVDSVLKNLNIKCPDINASNPIWYPQFYDMDTALGLNNSGGASNEKCFAGYVDINTNKLILDYAPDSENGWFDIPSSMLFLFAKYSTIVNLGADEAKKKTTWDNYNKTLLTPFTQWKILRGTDTKYKSLKYFGIFLSAEYFCDTYLYKHLGNIHPLLMNLNYAYKYFSVSANTTDVSTESSTDVEIHRFWGTLKWYRKWWLKLRLQFLDAMFGFRNLLYVGGSDIPCTCMTYESESNLDVGLFDTMYKLFTKGSVYARLQKVTVKGPLMYPLSIVENIELTPRLYFLAGEDEDIQIDIITSSDEDRGFYGSKILTYISDHGVFLSNTGNNVENTITNHEITEINIASFGTTSFSKEVCPKITLNLDNISNCRTISIGSSSPLYIKALRIVSTLNRHLTSVSLNNITITDTLSFEGVIIDTLSLKEMTITKLSFTDNCTIGKYYEHSLIKVSELNINSATFSSEETTLSSLEVCKVTINNLTFNTTFTLKYLYLAELSVTSLKGTGDSNTFNNYYLNNYTLETISITGTMTNIDCIKLNAAWTIPNGQSSSGNNTTAVIKTLNYTIKLGNKSSMPEISIPGCKALLTITLSSNSYILLGMYGLAYSPIENASLAIVLNSGYGVFFNCSNIMFDNISTDASGITPGYIYISLDMKDKRFDYFHSSVPFTGTIKTLFSLVKKIVLIGAISLQCAFIKNTPTDLLASLGNTLIATNEWPLSNLTLDQYKSVMKEVFDTNLGQPWNSTFAQTNIDFIPDTNLKKNFTYYNTFGNCYIEDTAVLNCREFYLNYTKLLDLNYTYGECHTTFIKKENDTWSRIVPNFKKLFPNLQKVRMSFVTTFDYPLDLQGGFPETLLEYQTILGYGQNSPYIINGTWQDANNEYKSFLDTGNVASFKTEALLDFTGDSFYNTTLDTYNLANSKYYINIYHALFKDDSNDSTSCILKHSDSIPRGLQTYWASWSMYKTCTYLLFMKIMHWLKNNENKSSINSCALGRLFKNCFVTDCPNPISFKEIESEGCYTGYLYGYTNLLGTFDNCHFLDASIREVYIDFTDLFAKKEKKTDTYTSDGKSPTVEYLLYKSTPVVCLYKAFKEMHLTPFAEFTYTPYNTETHKYLDHPLAANLFGIMSNSTYCTMYAFYGCKFNYNKKNWGAPRYIDISGLLGHVQYDYPEAPSIFPTNFLAFRGGVKGDICVTSDELNSNNHKEEFSVGGWDYNYSLLGTIPATNTWGLDPVQSLHMCNAIVYFQQDSKTYNYFIFPDWYCRAPMPTRASVIIPIPPTQSLLETLKSKYYLWNCSDSLITYYSRLPLYGTNNGGNGSTSVGDRIKDHILSINLGTDTTRLPWAGIKSIPRDLAYTLSLQSSWFDNYNYLVAANLNNTKPIIWHNIDAPDNNNLDSRNLATHIFRGSLSTANSLLLTLILGDSTYIQW